MRSSLPPVHVVALVIPGFDAAERPHESLGSYVNRRKRTSNRHSFKSLFAPFPRSMSLLAWLADTALNFLQTMTWRRWITPENPDDAKLLHQLQGVIEPTTAKEFAPDHEEDEEIPFPTIVIEEPLAEEGIIGEISGHADAARGDPMVPKRLLRENAFIKLPY